MKKFLKRIGVFCLILLLCTSILDFFITVELKKSNNFAIGEVHIWNTLFKGKINSDIYVYGSSRAWVHINPQIIEENVDKKVYNLGIDGHNFWLQYLRHKVLLDNNKKPQSIILSVGSLTLVKREDLYNYEQFLPFIYKKDIRKYTKSYKGFSALDYFLPLYRYRNKTEEIRKVIKSNLKSDGITPYRIDGYRGMNRIWNNDLKKAKSKIEKYSVEFDASTKQLFETFIKECNVLDIKLVLVYTPEYIEGQRFITNRKDIVSNYKLLSENNTVLNKF